MAEKQLFKQGDVVSAIPINFGVKIRVRDHIYRELINNEELNKKFWMNPKRLNRWWYSIYFGSWEEYHEFHPNLKKEK